MDSGAITAWVAAAMLLFQASIGIFGVRRRILREPHIVLGLIFTSAHIRTRLAVDEERVREVCCYGVVVARERRVPAVGSSGAVLGPRCSVHPKARAHLKEFTWRWDSAFSPSPARICCLLLIRK
jgi:hypothetical protein